MNHDTTKNAALLTTQAFHYQFLVGLRECFCMQEGFSVWFERDGDVSVLSETSNESIQTEVKNYSDALTDHHENFWKTLNNWLAPEFQHEKYGSLVLHTTQAFGVTSTLKDWDQRTAEERLLIIRKIYSSRSTQELTAEAPSKIVKLQRSVMGIEEDKLSALLEKVILFTQADNQEKTRNSIVARLTGIPKANQSSYLHAAIGFVYDSANNSNWEVSKSSFDEKCEELTSMYCRKEFTLPSFDGREATNEELSEHEEKLFVRKIQNIEYDEVISEAIGNWIELHNSLSEELDGAPQYRAITNRYQDQLIKKYERKYATSARNISNTVKDSQDLYDAVIGEDPPNAEGLLSPPLEYKNGLIHDAMDDDEQDIKWRVE